MAILLGNRPEFHLADLAGVTLGAATFSIYETYSPEQIAYVCADSGAKVAFVQRSHLAELRQAREQLPALEHVILVDPRGSDDEAGTTALDELVGAPAPADFDPVAASAAVGADDVCCLIYTSGTTGPPKCVQLTHANLMATVAGLEQIVRFPAGSRVISWLPAAHVAERVAHHYVPIGYGFEVPTCPEPKRIVEYLAAVHPNWFFAVPRIWEKLKSGLEVMLSGQPDEQRQRAQAALQAATRRVRRRQAGEAVPDEVERAVTQADTELFAKLRAQLGLDELAACNVGAAPTPPEVLELFHAIGVEVAELWGLSETCGYGSCNRPGAVRIGTVGPPSPGSEIKLDADGEVLVRGAFVMPGYRDAAQNAQAFTADGFLRTGDIGQIDADGYLTLVDRKKELIINAAGKNMSPAYIEAILKASSPLIGQAVCIGDRRRYNTALIVLDADFAPAWAAQHGLDGTTLEDLAGADAVRAAVQEGVDAANARLSRVESIRKLTIVPGDWAPGGDELTPTMKLRRTPIAAKYAGEIEAMYGE